MASTFGALELDFIGTADRILVIGKGRILESGTYQVLPANKTMTGRMSEKSSTDVTLRATIAQKWL
jgi:ABC-type multidrug transport system fused ATPase/permease subunit